MATVMANNATVHPFFARSTGPYEQATTHAGQGNRKIDEQTSHGASDDPSHEQRESKPVTKSRPQKQSLRSNGQPTLHQILHVETPASVTQDKFHDEATDLEIGHRDKRRKKSIEKEHDYNRENAPGTAQSKEETVAAGAIEPDVELHAVQSSGSMPEATVHNVDDLLPAAARMKTPPKKMLRLNGTGRFSSPISHPLKSSAASDGSEILKTRRARKGKDAQMKKALIVCFKYNAGESSESIGQRIERILAGQLSINYEKTAAKAPRTPRKQAKNTHPFFADKKTSAPVKQPSPRKAAASTPGKLRAQTRPEQCSSIDIPIYESALLKDRLMVKQPGAMEPLWPARGMNHVRGIESVDLPMIPLSRRMRKFKDTERGISKPESIITKFASSLQPEPDTILRDDGFREPASDIRIPERLLLSGNNIATSIAAELSVDLLNGPIEELAHTASQQAAIHPALVNLYKNIPAYMSGFDHLKGEMLGWAHRYAPTTADDVLQPVKEMNILKTWLESMTVNAVDVNSDKQVEMKVPIKSKKRRKLRHPDLDDFIVDEDEDIRSMDLLDDTESASGHASSIVQSQIAGVKSSNALLISGPSGCGKTAAVHAVAKELKYRVFEISSSERRSGRDILDKIGNLTGNHIVKSHNEIGPVKIDEASERIDAAFNKDLETGRQGKMSAFFKPKTNKITTKPTKQKLVKNIKNELKKPAKEQQQSLILLEEVDILFKDDKEFWSTVLKLIISSKRPFIMTCNDEDLVPIQAMSLHAVLRLMPPQIDLAADYLLLVAAREGHLLSRTSTYQLWKASCCDLRRSLNMLDFWCRMGVGDIRDGLGWMFSRWPPGSDLDDKGRPFRVVSKGTFQVDMVTKTELDTRLTANKDPYAHGSSHTLEDRQSNPLLDCDRQASSLSDVDLLSYEKVVDPTLPLIPEKTQAQFVEGMTLLDVQEAVDFYPLAGSIHAFTRSLAVKLWEDQFPAPDFTKAAPKTLTRKDFGVFDVLATPLTSSSQSSGLESSVFDGSLKEIAVDIAPYVRQIVRYDLALEEQRNALSGHVKRARKTRAARSALEGGQRQLTRRAEWFEGAGDLSGVLSTGGSDWHILHSDPAFE